jgi:hypothetical protein
MIDLASVLDYLLKLLGFVVKLSGAISGLYTFGKDLLLGPSGESPDGGAGGSPREPSQRRRPSTAFVAGSALICILVTSCYEIHKRQSTVVQDQAATIKNLEDKTREQAPDPPPSYSPPRGNHTPRNGGKPHRGNNRPPSNKPRKEPSGMQNVVAPPPPVESEAATGPTHDGPPKMDADKVYLYVRKGNFIERHLYFWKHGCDDTHTKKECVVGSAGVVTIPTKWAPLFDLTPEQIEAMPGE